MASDYEVTPAFQLEEFVTLDNFLQRRYTFVFPSKYYYSLSSIDNLFSYVCSILYVLRNRKMIELHINTYTKSKKIYLKKRSIKLNCALLILYYTTR